MGLRLEGVYRVQGLRFRVVSGLEFSLGVGFRLWDLRCCGLDFVLGLGFRVWV